MESILAQWPRATLIFGLNVRSVRIDGTIIEELSRIAPFYVGA